MTFDQIPVERLDITQTMGAQDKSARSAGVHLSTVINDLLATIDQAKGKNAGGWALENSGQIGFMWENIFEGAMRRMFNHEMYVRATEQCRDGIYGTPDFINVAEWAVADTKVRWKSVRHWDTLEESFRDVLWQLKGYCKMLDMTDAELIILFVNGDWKGSGPQVRGCKIHFERYEIEDNWRMILRHAEKHHDRLVTKAVL